jgi:glutaredoxin 3
MTATVTIYTRALCGYCWAATRLLRKKGVAFEEIDATGDNATRAWLAQVTGRTTVPQVFINGKSVGGADDLRRSTPRASSIACWPSRRSPTRAPDPPLRADFDGRLDDAPVGAGRRVEDLDAERRSARRARRRRG